MRRTIEQSVFLLGRRGVILFCLVFTMVGLLVTSFESALAQRPRIGVAARRLNKQQQQNQQQTNSRQSQSSDDSDEPLPQNQAGNPNRQANALEGLAPEELALLPRGLGAGQMRALIRVFRQLDLTNEQRQKLRELNRAHGNQLPVLTRLLRAQNEALDEVLYGNNFDPKVAEQRAADVAATQGEIIKARAKIMSELRQILTNEQAGKFRTLLEQERLRILQENRQGTTSQP